MDRSAAHSPTTVTSPNAPAVLARCLRLVVSTVFIAIVGFGCSAAGPATTAVDGRLDLSGWDFDRDGDVALLGTWEICWNQLLVPDEGCPSGWRPVPVRGLWSEESVHSPFGGQGFATYRLRVELPPGEGPLSVVVGGPLTAHRLWINGVERGGLGVVGRTPETTTATVFNRVYSLDAASDEIVFQVQVANFEFRAGGLRRIWFLGHTDSIQSGMGRAILREATLFAVGVVVGLGFLALFALRPAEQARGYFGMLSLTLGLRAVPASISTFGELVAPWMTWGLTCRLEYLGMALAYFAAVGYARTKVPGVMPIRAMKGLQMVALAFGAIVVFAPMPIALATLPLQWILPMLLIGLVILCYGRAWLRGIPGVGITAATAVVYVGFVAHDILRSIWAGSGATIELFPYAMVIWLFAEAYQLLQEFHRSLEQVEALSDDLSEANFELQETESAIVRFVPFDFLQALGKQSIRDVNAGDHTRTQMSVLHCGFHADFDLTDPDAGGRDFERVSDLIGCLEPCIYRRSGFLNDYRGDGFQAFFPGGPADAVAAAIEIVDAARDFNARSNSSGRSGIEVAIGIDTGWVQLGTIGSTEHLVRGVMGKAVDTAAQIEALTTGTKRKVLISAATQKGLGMEPGFETRAVETPNSVVDANSIEVYELIGAR